MGEIEVEHRGFLNTFPRRLSHDDKEGARSGGKFLFSIRRQLGGGRIKRKKKVKAVWK